MRLRGTRGLSRIAVAVAAALACGLLLTGCDGKVDTVMSVQDGVKGTRTMAVTFNLDAFPWPSSGPPVASWDASIRNHLPPGLEYSGLSAGSGFGPLTATFTLPFASLDAYKREVAALLAYGDTGITPAVTLTMSHSLFADTAQIRENFSSNDLLAWVARGLASDGDIDSAVEAGVVTPGSTTVQINGTSYGIGSTIDLSTRLSHGVTQVMVATQQTNNGFSRTIQLSMPTATYDANAAGFDAYVTGVTPPSGKAAATTTGTTRTWTISFSAADAAGIVSATNKILGSKDAVFSVTQGPSKANPGKIVTTFRQYEECAAICSSANSGGGQASATAGKAATSAPAQPIVDELSVPSGWKLTSGNLAKQAASAAGTQSGMAVYGGNSTKNAAYTFERSIPIDAASVATTVGFGQTVDQTWTFTVASADETAAGFTAMLTPPPTTGTLTQASNGGNTVYTVHIQASSLADYNAKIGAWIKGASLDIRDDPGASFFQDSYTVAPHIDLTALIGTGTLATPLAYTFTLPFGDRLDATASSLPGGATASGAQVAFAGEPNDTGMTLAVTGFTLAGMIVAAGILLVLIAAIVLVLLLRSRRNKAREHRASQHRFAD